MSVTLRQLEVFVAVSEEGGITRAGEVMGLPQSSISTQLKELEETLGLRLFDRHTRKLRLTAAGIEILPLARKTLADLDAMMDGSSQLKTLERGRVSIAASSIQAALVLPRMIKAFKDEHPGIRVALLDLAQDDVISMVQAGAVDFGVGTEAGDHPELNMRKLWSEPFYAVLPPGHELAKKRAVTWRELQKFPLIASRKGNPVRAVLEFELAAHGISLNFEHETTLPWSTVGMVAGGLGIGILTGSVRVFAETLGLALRPIEQPIVQRDVVLVMHSEYSLSPAAKKLSDSLLAWTVGMDNFVVQKGNDAESNGRGKFRHFCHVCYQFDCRKKHPATKSKRGD